MTSPEEQGTVPVVREELAVGKRTVETGEGIRVTKTVSERQQVVDELLAKEDVAVERVSVNRVVDAANIPGIRQEGSTIIVPVLEEILVVEKRTIVKEELRITSTRREVREPEKFVLRSEEVSVERFDERPDQQSNP
jgi:uncharacterized protein (TIGR02271 family)